MRAASASLLPLAFLSLASIATSTLTGCSDENDPKTWVKKLNTPADKPTAIKRLEAFYEDTVNKAVTNNDGGSGTKVAHDGRDAPEVKALLDVIVDPLTAQYVSGDLDEKTRIELIKSLAAMADPRTAPALVKAFGTCDATQGSEDAKSAAKAVTTMVSDGTAIDPSIPDPLWTCFAKLRASTKAGGTIPPVHDAVLAVKSPSYGAKAVALLAAPVDPKDADSKKDQLKAWQLTAVQVIRDTKFTDGARALVQVLLTPEKGELWSLSEQALLSMPAAAEPLLIAALKGTDAEFARMGAAFADKGYILNAADALGWLSRPAGRDAILAAIPLADNDTNRQGLAITLVKFPNVGTSWPAFKGVYDKLPSGSADPSVSAQQAAAKGKMAQAAVQFYDPGVVDWAVKESNAAKGDSASLLQISALDTASKLMSAAQAPSVKAALDPVVAFLQKDGSQNEQASAKSEKAFNDAATAVLAKCGTDPMCFVKLLDAPISSDPSGLGTPLKAVYAAVMTAGTNGAAVKQELVNRVAKISQPGVRLALTEAIDHLSPAGDTASAAALEKIVDADKATGSTTLMAADDAVAKVAMRLRSRATP